MPLRHFQLSEFDSPDIPGSGSSMDTDFLEVLEAIREDAGIPFIITSGFRTEEYNIKVGGVENSAHLRGKAADIRAGNARNKYIIVHFAIKHGITRIGIGKTFIHLDIDQVLPNPAIWVY